MIDPEIKKHLDIIEGELVRIRKGYTSLGNALWRGIISGAGYVIGAVIIIVIVGWILNIVGFIPALSNQVTEFRTALQNIGNTVK